MTNIKQSKSLLARAYNLKKDEAKPLYRDWALTYDNDLVESLGYVGPVCVADIAHSFCADVSAHILDVGCGTGLVALRLSQLGYQRIDGLDFSKEMLEVARSKNIYADLINADLTKTLSIKTAVYDLVVSCGTFTHSHVGPEAFDEILRIIRPGGIACVSINAEIYESNGFSEKLRALECADKILMQSKVKIQLTVNEPVDGFVVVLKKL
jgi:predicted TPR repeat methyltransferase